MKAILSKSDLLAHKRIFQKAAKPQRGMANKTFVTLTVSDKFAVAGPGLSHAMECQAVAWGRTSVPYNIWKRLMQTLRFTSETEVTVAAEDGKLEVDKLSINNPNIQVVHTSPSGEGKP
jgi:hypothetical protein